MKKKQKNGRRLEDAKIERRDTETIWVTTKEGWIYEITENEVKLKGKKGENPPPDLEDADITFILEPEGYTNQNVTVEIQLNKDIEGFTLQYSRDGKKWDNYTTGEKILYTEKGMIYAKLINALEEEGGTASKPIDNIDREKPNEAVITFNKNPISMGETLTATVTQSDAGTSGLELANCRYIFTTTGTALGIDTPSQYTGGNFSSKSQTLTLNSSKLGTYYLHVLSVDKAGNKRESISKAITIKDTTPPSDAVISFDKTSYNVGDTAKAKVKLSDKQSGVDISKCGWLWSPVSEPIGTGDLTKYPNRWSENYFVGNDVSILCATSGTYYLHVLTVDYAGNKKETISSAINVQKLVKWLVKDGKIVDSNYGSTGWVNPKQESGYVGVNRKCCWRWISLWILSIRILLACNGCWCSDKSYL